MKRSHLVLLSLCVFNFLGSFSQNMGIGISNPTRAKLEISGAVGNTVAIFGGDAQGISIQRQSPAIGFNQYYNTGGTIRNIADGYSGMQWLDAATGNMYFDSYTSGFANNPSGTPTTLMTINSSGRVGIGVAPHTTARLNIGRGTGPDGTAVFRGSVYPSHFNYSTNENTYIRGGKNGSYVYINNVSGRDIYLGKSTNMVKVGINSGDPMYALEIKQVGGLGLILVRDGSFANWHLNVGPTTAQGGYHRLHYNEAANPIGSFHPQTGAYVALSDIRFKEDIKPLETISEKLMQLRPVQYEMKLDYVPAGKKMGFIAQDVKKIFPDLVHISNDTIGQSLSDMHLLNYDGMAVYIIQVIQEQQQKIEALKARIESLKKLN